MIHRMTLKSGKSCIAKTEKGSIMIDLIFPIKRIPRRVSYNCWPKDWHKCANLGTTICSEKCSAYKSRAALLQTDLCYCDSPSSWPPIFVWYTGKPIKLMEFKTNRAIQLAESKCRARARAPKLAWPWCRVRSLRSFVDHTNMLHANVNMYTYICTLYRIVLKHRLIWGPGRQINKHSRLMAVAIPWTHGTPGAHRAHGAHGPMGPMALGARGPRRRPAGGRRPMQINLHCRLMGRSPRLNQTPPDHQPTLSISRL